MRGNDLQFEVTGAQQFAQLARHLKANDRQMKNEMAAAVRKATKPAVNEVKAAILAVESHSYGGGRKAREQYAQARGSKTASRGLRAAIARGITARTAMSVKSAGVRIHVNTTQLPPDQKSLPALMDGGRTWRHPVFGNREVWVTQQAAPWFYVTLYKLRDPVAQELLLVVDRFMARISK